MNNPISTEFCLKLLVRFLIFKNNEKIIVIFPSKDKLKEFKENLLTLFNEVPEYLRPVLLKSTSNEVQTKSNMSICLVVQRRNLSNALRGVTASYFLISTDVVNKSVDKFVEEFKSFRPFSELQMFT